MGKASNFRQSHKKNKKLLLEEVLRRTKWNRSQDRKNTSVHTIRHDGGADGVNPPPLSTTSRRVSLQPPPPMLCVFLNFLFPRCFAKMVGACKCRQKCNVLREGGSIEIAFPGVLTHRIQYKANMASQVIQP